MRFHTLLTERFGIPIPIILSPLPSGITTPKFVVAACKNGILGTLDGSDLEPKALGKAIRKIRRRLRNQPFAVHLNIPEFPNVSEERMSHTYHLLAPFWEKLGLTADSLPDHPTPLFEEQMLVVLKERVPFFSFSNGMLHGEWIKLLRGSGTLLMGTATTTQEAEQLSELPLHLIRLQGAEASGVRSTFLAREGDGLIPIKELLETTQELISTPLVPEGGIMTGEEVLEFLNQGSAGVSMGTAFLAAKESGAPPSHKAALLTSEGNTTLSPVFTGHMGRTLPNKLTDWADHHPFEILECPIQKSLMQPILNIARKRDLLDFLPLWSNDRARLCQTGKTADIIEKLLLDIYHLIK